MCDKDSTLINNLGDIASELEGRIDQANQFADIIIKYGGEAARNIARDFKDILSEEEE